MQPAIKQIPKGDLLFHYVDDFKGYKLTPQTNMGNLFFIKMYGVKMVCRHIPISMVEAIYKFALKLGLTVDRID